MNNSKIKIVLYEPEIPQNTGNIVRLCACSNVELFLCGKLGFSLDEKHLKRAGLDYWDDVKITQLQTLSQIFELYPNADKFYMTTKAKKSHFEADFHTNNNEKLLIFGPETRGLPEEILFSDYENCYRIPMEENQRSLNLSNSVAITLYEAIRQINFMN